LIGLDAVMSIEGATDTAVFRAFVEQVPVPTLAAGDIVVMDNLSSHKVGGIREAIEAAGAALLSLLPIRRIIPPSKTAGQSSKRICEKPRPAYGKPLTMP
jgi:hypothetical protein